MKDLMTGVLMAAATILMLLLSIELTEYNYRIEQIESKLNERPQTVEEVVYEVPPTYELAEQIYGVDAALLEAIERLETGHFKSDLYINQSNSYGATYDGVNFITYESHDQSTFELARNLKFNYINQGLDTIELISSKFCPDDKATQINEADEWAKNVRLIYEELRGNE